MKNKFVIIKGIVIAIVVVFVILILFMLSKVYQMVIVSRVFEAVEEFRNEENRGYWVETIINGKMVLKEEIILKQEIVKHVKKKNGSIISYKCKNFDQKEECFVNIKNKKIYRHDIMIKNENTLYNLPNFIEYSFDNDKFNLYKIFDVHYILPTKYQDKLCYKIITKNEVIIVEKDTYLPIYSSIKRMKSNEESKSVIERTYEFKVGEVTDEDVELPDLSEYTFVEN